MARPFSSKDAKRIIEKHSLMISRLATASSLDERYKENIKNASDKLAVQEVLAVLRGIPVEELNRAKTIAYVQFFNKDGTVSETTTYTFDYCGNLVESHTRSDDSEHTTTYRYEYKKVPLASAPQNIYVYHTTLPELDIFDWYDVSNV